MNSNKCTNNVLNTLLIVHCKERLLIGSIFPWTIKVLMIKATNSDCNLFHKTITKETALEILQTPHKKPIQKFSSFQHLYSQRFKNKQKSQYPKKTPSSFLSNPFTNRRCRSWTQYPYKVRNKNPIKELNNP